MGELMEIAKAHYESASPGVQALARNFFKSMDTDGNHKVDLQEFLSFMEQEKQGHVQMRNRQFFKELDMDNKGTLGFWDVMTVFYIIKSGRPFCDRCGAFIPGLYFSCVDCYKSTPNCSYYLCRECYQSKRCKHNHSGCSQFLDNYTLLEATRDSALAKATGVDQEYRGKPLMKLSKAKISELPMEVYVHSTNLINYGSPSRYPIVPYISPSRLSKFGATFRALQIAITAASLYGCTIM